MARVDFRVPSVGVDVDGKIVIRSSSQTGSTNGDIWNDSGSLKFYNGSATKTIAFTDSSISASQLPAFTGDATSSAGTSALTLATVNSNVGSFGAASTVPVITVNGKGLITAVSTATVVAAAGTLSGSTLASGVTASSLTSVGTLTGLTVSGDVAVNGGDLTTTATTFNLVNGTATTVNFGGAATSLNIGNASGTVTFANDVTITGDLIVNGTTTTVNSTVVTIDDPVFTLGGDTAPGSDDGKDRGIEFRWHNGSTAKLGFFGFDDSTGKFTFIPDATNTSEVFSGTKGTLDVGTVETSTLFVDSIEVDTTGATSSQVLQFNGTKFAPATLSSASSFTTIAVSGQSNVVADSGSDTLTFAAGTGISLTTNATTDTVTVTNSGVTSILNTDSNISVSGSTGAVTLGLPATISSSTTGSAASLTTSRTFSVTGAVATSSAASFNGTGNVTLNVSMQANAVTLGTHTTGNYVANVTGGTGVTVTGTATEGWTPQISIGQAVATTSNVTFGSVSTSATENGGTATTLQRSSYDATTSVSPNVIESHAVSGHTTVKYLIQAVQGNNTVSTEILAVYNNSTVNYTEYATVVVGTAPATFSVAFTNSAIELSATAASSSATSYRVFSTAIAA